MKNINFNSLHPLRKYKNVWVVNQSDRIIDSKYTKWKKISIMLEEIKFQYKVTKINILKGAQFEPKFRAISPFSKIPVID